MKQFVPPMLLNATMADQEARACDNLSGLTLEIRQCDNIWTTTRLNREPLLGHSSGTLRMGLIMALCTCRATQVVLCALACTWPCVLAGPLKWYFARWSVHGPVYLQDHSSGTSRVGLCMALCSFRTTQVVPCASDRHTETNAQSTT